MICIQRFNACMVVFVFVILLRDFHSAEQWVAWNKWHHKTQINYAKFVYDTVYTMKPVI